MALCVRACVGVFFVRSTTAGALWRWLATTDGWRCGAVTSLLPLATTVAVLKLGSADPWGSVGVRQGVRENILKKKKKRFLFLGTKRPKMSLEVRGGPPGGPRKYLKIYIYICFLFLFVFQYSGALWKYPGQKQEAVREQQTTEEPSAVLQKIPGTRRTNYILLKRHISIIFQLFMFFPYIYALLYLIIQEWRTKVGSRK